MLLIYLRNCIKTFLLSPDPQHCCSSQVCGFTVPSGGALYSKLFNAGAWSSSERCSRETVGLGALQSLSPAPSLQCHTRRGKLAEWLHGATHECGRHHVDAGPEPARGFTALTPTPSYFLHVRVSLFMCVWVFFSPSFMFAFDAEWQGNPEPPTFSCCLYFSPPHPPPPQFFAHLASVSSLLTLCDWDGGAQIPYTSRLGQR